jgi:putative membrane protein
MSMWFGTGGPWLELLFFALGLAFWGGLIALIFLGIRWLVRHDGGGAAAGRGSGASQAEDPFEILRRRYAAGEIDDEEYARRRKTLGG